MREELYGTGNVVTAEAYRRLGRPQRALATLAILGESYGPNQVPGRVLLLEGMAQKAPLRRNIDQMDVGNTATFLLSDLARGITGQTIYVDAGYSILGA